MSAVDGSCRCSGLWRSATLSSRPRLITRTWNSTGRGRCPMPGAGMAARRRWSIGRAGLRRGIPSRPTTIAGSARAWSPRARMRLWCCGISAGAIAPAGSLTRQFLGCTRSAAESSPGHRCSTSTRSQLPNSWQDPKFRWGSTSARIGTVNRARYRNDPRESPTERPHQPPTARANSGPGGPGRDSARRRELSTTRSAVGA
jgi:hypothetical protein